MNSAAHPTPDGLNGSPHGHDAVGIHPVERFSPEESKYMIANNQQEYVMEPVQPLNQHSRYCRAIFGALLLIIIAIIPTLIYVVMISYFGNPEGNIDMGSTMGSYFGLLFLIGGYTAIGVFTRFNERC